jgi:hypothetical protein
VFDIPLYFDYSHLCKMSRLHGAEARGSSECGTRFYVARGLTVAGIVPALFGLALH